MDGVLKPPYPENLFGPGSPVRVIGHRGAAAAAPENTLPSFRRALESGVDAVELDLHCTRCGELIVIHDDTLERTTDGAGDVEALNLEDLQKLDAGYGFTPDNGDTHPFRGQGIRVPTFQEVLAAVPDLPVIAEIKSPRAGAALGNWLTDNPDRERILVGGFRRSDVDPAGRRARWRCAYTDELRLYVLFGKLGIAGIAVPRVDAAMVPERHKGLHVVTPGFIRRCHRDGIGVFIWTVNDPVDMRRLLDWGVDGMVSDSPARLRRILDERLENQDVSGGG